MIKKAIKRRSNTPKPEEYTWGGAISGLSTGASLGASIGSVIPGIGTVIGGIVGGVAGAIGGVITSDQDAADEALSRRKATNELENANYYSNTSSRNQMGITTKVAYGGMIPPNAVAEGGEVLKTPDGQVDTLQGPSHAKGGIPIIAPQGTKVYSDRLKHNLNGKKETYADSAARLNKLLDKYKKTDDNEDSIKKGSDALMIARIQRQLDTLFQAQELDKEEKGIGEDSTKEFANGGTTGWPPYKEWNPYAMNSNNEAGFNAYTDQGIINKAPSIQSIYNSGSDNLYNNVRDKDESYIDYNSNVAKPLSAYKLPINDNTPPKNTQLFKNAPNRPADIFNSSYFSTDQYNTAIDKATSIKAGNIPSVDSGAMQKITPRINPNDITGVVDKSKDTTSNLNKAGDVIGTIAEAAPMIYNMFQPKPDKMSTAEYMNTKMFNPERMDTTNDIREAERTYSAIINDQSLSPQQRMLASRQLQAVKGQVLQQANNMYKQDMNRAEELNANIRQQNIDTAMKIKDTNNANVAAYANSKAQAAGDLSQMVQNKRLAMNIRKSNDMQMNAVQSAFPDIEFKKDGTMSKKGGAPFTKEELENINKFIYTMTSLNQYNTGSYQGYNNNGHINSANYDLQQGNQ